MRIALIDGPLDPGDPAVALTVRLRPGDGPHSRAHAAAMRAALLAGCPSARLLNLVVFGAGLSADAATIAAALDRAAAIGADIALCAFGMARRDEALAAACARAVAAGCAVVAAAPARGEPCFPAALPGVASVQGDARCGPGDWSRLDLPTAAWGACPRAEGHEAAAGASTAAAHFAGLLAARGSLAAMADAPFLGRERRLGTGDAT